MTFKLDPKLREYATDRQWEILNVWAENGSQKIAAKVLRCGSRNIRHAHLAVMRRAGQHGYAPDYDLTHPTAPGMSSKGTSVRYDAQGNVQSFWNK